MTTPPPHQHPQHQHPDHQHPDHHEHPGHPGHHGEAPLLNLKDPKILVSIGLTIAALAWLIIPPRSIALDEQCHPVGFQSSISATLTQGWFWNRQLHAVEARRDHLLAIQNRGDADQDVENISPIESRMDRLSQRNGAHETTQEEKDAIIKARQTDRIARLAVLMQCADKIERYGRGN